MQSGPNQSSDHNSNQFTTSPETVPPTLTHTHPRPTSSTSKPTSPCSCPCVSTSHFCCHRFNTGWPGRETPLLPESSPLAPGQFRNSGHRGRDFQGSPCSLCSGQADSGPGEVVSECGIQGTTCQFASSLLILVADPIAEPLLALC